MNWVIQAYRAFTQKHPNATGIVAFAVGASIGWIAKGWLS